MAGCSRDIIRTMVSEYFIFIPTIFNLSSNVSYVEHRGVWCVNDDKTDFNQKAIAA